MIVLNCSEIPISVVAPLIEYNTTLVIEQVNEYHLLYDVPSLFYHSFIGCLRSLLRWLVV